jgi:hypothetical protein
MTESLGGHAEDLGDIDQADRPYVHLTLLARHALGRKNRTPVSRRYSSPGGIGGILEPHVREPPTDDLRAACPRWDAQKAGLDEGLSSSSGRYHH